MRTPAQIDYGVADHAHHLTTFDRVAPRVRLHTRNAGEATDVESVTSVRPKAGETENALKTRLVVNAARLLRRLELQEAQKSPVSSQLRV